MYLEVGRRNLSQLEIMRIALVSIVQNGEGVRLKDDSWTYVGAAGIAYSALDETGKQMLGRRLSYEVGSWRYT